MQTLVLKNLIYFEKKSESSVSWQYEQGNIDNLGINFCRKCLVLVNLDNLDIDFCTECRVLVKLSMFMRGRGSFPTTSGYWEPQNIFNIYLFQMILNFFSAFKIIAIYHESRKKATNFMILLIEDFLAKYLEINIAKPTLVDFKIVLI